MKRILAIVHRFEDAVLVCALAALVVVAALQIILRNAFDTGIVWGDIFLRILVLWTAVLGAMVAAREGKHLRIDALARYLDGRYSRELRASVELASAAVCALVAYQSIGLIVLEYEGGDTAFGVIPVWVCQLIIPFGFAVIACRFVGQAAREYLTDRR